MATERDRQDERDRLGNDPFDADAGNGRDQENPDETGYKGERELEAERQASTSMESPSNVTRSTQDLTIGGDKKDPQAADRREDETTTAGPRPSRQSQARNRALESGEESPG